MKPKAALKRMPIAGDAPAAAPIHALQKPQSPRGGLTLLPKLETSTPYHPWASAYTSCPPQSWFRKYDVNGKVVEEGLSLGEVPLFCWIYSYRTTGSKVQAVLLNAERRLLEKRVYDEAERLTRKIIFAGDGTEEQIDYEVNGAQDSNRRPELRRDLFRAA